MTENRRRWALEGRFSRSPCGRRFAIGDVHGCAKTLRAMVEEVIGLRPGDTLYLLGDYIDRGPDSKGVLDYLIRLVGEPDFDVQPLLGNHEQLMLQAVAHPTARRTWYGNGGQFTLDSFGVASPEEIPQHYLDFVAGLPTIKILNDYVLAHAGLDFRFADPVAETPEFDLLWIRDFRADAAKLGGRTLLHGHTRSMLHEIESSLRGPVIPLDNGCFDRGHIGYGSLVALDLDWRQLLVQGNVD